ncbi:MAG: polyprenyl synthetase family protein, partial [Actinobacteria bacterium]|nr:polyprenyl synthetase family protein [Actinomycetota bacterium]
MRTDALVDRRPGRSLPEILAQIRPGLEAVETLLSEAAHVPDLPMLASILASVLSGPAKRLRPALALLACEALGTNGAVPVTLATATEVLHSATLVHDDIVDSAASRRGKPAAHVAWSDKLAVLAGDYLFATAADLVARLERPRIVRQFADTIQRMARSEFVAPSFADGMRAARAQYLDKIGNKTASLVALACDAAAELAGAPDIQRDALHAFGWNVGLAFQVIDDILDVSGSSGDTGKPVGGDLRHGTLTLPVIIYLESGGERDGLVRRVVSGQASDDASMDEALRRLRASGAADAAHAWAAELAAQ